MLRRPPRSRGPSYLLVATILAGHVPSTAIRTALKWRYEKSESSCSADCGPCGAGDEYGLGDGAGDARQCSGSFGTSGRGSGAGAVSYTHLTLPTIYSV